MKYIFDLRTIPEEKLSVSGGKAASLSLMMKNLNMSIPMGYVITAEGFRDGKLTDEASEELNGIIAKLDRLKTYAVRSSAIGEDGENNSFAGQYETLTDVIVPEIRNAVKHVADSAKSERVEEYKSRNDQVGEHKPPLAFFYGRIERHTQVQNEQRIKEPVDADETVAR